jgi:hypothetical protein
VERLEKRELLSVPGFGVPLTMMPALTLLGQAKPLSSSAVAPSTYCVATWGSDFAPGTWLQPFCSIQYALDQARHPGDTVYVYGGVYNEQIQFNHSGNAHGSITLEAYPGAQPFLDGTGFNGGPMVLMDNVSYVRLIGFTIQNDNNGGGASAIDANGVFVTGAGTNIQILDNTIHDISGVSAMGITVYGTSVQRAIANLTIDGNTLYNLQAAPSEALTVDGNIKNFRITNNVVHDVNNIGIDMAGGYADINPLYVPRNGEVSGNIVYNCRSNYGGGFANGIYVDGGKNITIERNITFQNDQGIEVGAEIPGIVASGVVVRDNLIYYNDKAGLVFGGYQYTVGRVNNCFFVNNTIYDNDTLLLGYGQIDINFGSYNVLTNNIIWASADDVMLDYEGGPARTDIIDHNLYYTPDGYGAAYFIWRGHDYYGLAAFHAATGRDAHSIFADPGFVDAALADFHLLGGSPAFGKGSKVKGQFAPTDFDGVPVPPGGAPTIGAFEL